MSAGIVDHETHTRDLRRLGGLRHLMPITFAIGTIASLSMAGMLFFNGFLSKEMMLEEAAQTDLGRNAWAVPRARHHRLRSSRSPTPSASSAHGFLGPVARRLPAHAP